MTVKTRKIVREYVYEVSGLDYPIFGRIVKSDHPDLPFEWEISHEYCPKEEGNVYRPSARSFSTKKEADSMLNAYGRSFTSIGVVPVDSYSCFVGKP